MSHLLVSKQNFSLASQCLAFSKTLVSHGKPVSFSLKIGSCLEFSLDTRDEVKVPAFKVRKPSTMRRNQRRKNEFLASKKGLFTTEKTPNHEKTLDDPVLETKNVDNNSGEKTAVACDECGHSTKTKNGLKLHKKNKHGVPQLEGSEFICKEK